MTGQASRYGQGARFWIAWGGTLVATALLVGLATLPPFVDGGWRVMLMQAFSMVCHQIPERSPHLYDVQLAVCHRCYGIYWGLPLAVVAFLWLRRWDGRIDRYARYVVLAGVLVPGTDWLVDLAGLWTNTPASRLVTGSVFGLMAGTYLVRAVVEAAARDSREETTERGADVGVARVGSGER